MIEEKEEINLAEEYTLSIANHLKKNRIKVAITDNGDNVRRYIKMYKHNELYITMGIWFELKTGFNGIYYSKIRADETYHIPHNNPDVISILMNYFNA